MKTKNLKITKLLIIICFVFSLLFGIAEKCYSMPPGKTYGVIGAGTVCAGALLWWLGTSFDSDNGNSSAPAPHNPSAPSINSSLTKTVVINNSIDYQITATNNPTSYNATGLPVGLRINTATGIIYGIPTSLGQTNITISATNAGGTGSAVLKLTVTTGSAAQMQIDSNSQNQKVLTNKQFANNFKATLTDKYGNGISGASVVFTAPSSGPSCAFGSLSGSNTVTVQTDSNGLADSGPVYANDIQNASPNDYYDVTVQVSSTSIASQSIRATNILNAPIITSLSKIAGKLAGGDTLTIVGDNFTDATAVYFGKTSAKFTVYSNASITVTTPAASAGTVDVTLVTPYGTSNTTMFTYQPAPVLDGTYDIGSGGTILTAIHGDNFSALGGDIVVTIAGLPVTVQSYTATSVNISTNAPNPEDKIIVMNGDGQSAIEYYPGAG